MQTKLAKNLDNIFKYLIFFLISFIWCNYYKQSLAVCLIASIIVASILSFVTSLNSTTVFYENSFKYSEEDFPLSQNECQYDVIDYFAIVDGYEIDGEFQKDPHIVAVTTSDTKIDLYNSSCFSTEDFKEKTETFLTEKGIEIKNVKTI